MLANEERRQSESGVTLPNAHPLSPPLNNLTGNTVPGETPATPPPQVASSEQKSTESSDSFSFLSGSGEKATEPAKPVEPETAKKIPTKIILNQRPVELGSESSAVEKSKTKLLTPSTSPSDDLVQTTASLPDTISAEKKGVPWLTSFLSSQVQKAREFIFPPPDENEPRIEVVSSEPQPATPAKPVTSSSVSAPIPNNGQSLIQTTGLVKQYGGRRVVNGVDIYVKPGEVVGLLGRNGAGKTTTFYMIVGLVTPTEGHVHMGDEDVTLMPMYRRARRGIGYLPQEESIFRKLTVEENLLAILETLHISEEERDARCDALLKDFGLEHVRESVAITLSGGEKRRVTIARALVTSPTLLLLDEPFAGVDPMAVHDIQEIILQLKNRGLGVLVTDHSVRETLSVVDRAYIIDEGRVLSTGSREFLLNDPVAREIYLGHRFSM